MKFDFIVVGATGMQGRIVVRDLLESGYSVLLCGRDKSRISHFLKSHSKTEFKYIEATKISTIINAIKYANSNVVINCMEGNWNYAIFKICTRMGLNCIDLGSEIPDTKRQFSLNSAMKKKN